MLNLNIQKQALDMTTETIKSRQIKHLIFDQDTANEYIPPDKKTNKTPVCVPNLSKINILVGPNNSGKSRLLRRVLQGKFKHFQKVDLTQRELSIINTAFSQYIEPNNQSANKFSSWLHKENDTQNGNAPEDAWLNYCAQSSITGSTLKDHFLADYLYQQFINKLCLGGQSLPENEINRFINEGRSCTQSLSSHIQSNQISDINNIKYVYIPLLRGLRPLMNASDLNTALGLTMKDEQVSIPLSNRVNSLFGEANERDLENLLDFYKNTTLRDYRELKSSDISIYTGLNIYYDIRRLLLGSHHERLKARKFEEFLSQHFFEGAEVELTPRASLKGVLHVKIGKGEDMPIHMLGDGIQAMIAILYPLLTQLHQSDFYFIGIEEPELNLHPGLQRQLIKALMDIPNAQFFLTTHSNHFLESLFDEEDISLYKINKNYTHDDSSVRAYTQITPLADGNKSVLADLGVINSSLFLSNCTIWVEGVTDRHLFQHYLSLYHNHLSKTTKPVALYEGKHYSFVEYGGANITHWSWLDLDKNPINVERLCGTVMLIADDDNATKGAKAERLDSLSNKLEERFIRLNCKETENLHSDIVLGRILSTYAKSGCDCTFKAKWSTYQKRPIGKYLDDIIKSKGFTMKNSQKNFKSGNTVSNKTQFNERAIKATKVWDDLTEEAKRVTQEIYQFILKQNTADCYTSSNSNH
ncbi:ATP-dependent nuclease [Persicirhabdus sediminis]|uniref:AAA family ATPase n=1 Tax=Persicirhabdus sediminis TaxID=454144 RepID=A0A8J7MAP4_9BACT|nr:AAA family ATPase [Persicirhabdus sediminis]MBK1789977.1 AAA family ATPase [Persicirhabdus sediminis]